MYYRSRDEQIKIYLEEEKYSVNEVEEIINQPDNVALDAHTTQWSGVASTFFYHQSLHINIVSTGYFLPELSVPSFIFFPTFSSRIFGCNFYIKIDSVQLFYPQKISRIVQYCFLFYNELVVYQYADIHWIYRWISHQIHIIFSFLSWNIGGKISFKRWTFFCSNLF